MLPWDRIDIDFETGSDLNIDVGARKYAGHSSTFISMVNYSFNEGPVIHWNPYFSKTKKPHTLLIAAHQGVSMHAFNSEFEYWIWNLVATRQFGWPELPVDQFYCLMAQSCSGAFPANLEGSAAAINVSAAFKDSKHRPVEKRKTGKALIKQFSVEKASPYEFRDDYNDFIDYGRDDVTAQIHVSRNTPVLTEYEQDILLMTDRMNQRGIPINVDMVKGALALVKVCRNAANKELREMFPRPAPFYTFGQRDAIKEWLNANGCDIPDMQKDTMAKYVQMDWPRRIKRVLELRSQYAMSSTAKYEKMLHMVTEEGKVHGFIKAFIARTGRWGGRGIQIQNFVNPHKIKTIKAGEIDWLQVCELITNRDFDGLQAIGPVMDLLAGALRAAIQAPEGYKIVAADYAQIEARLIMWFANALTGLKEFRTNAKIYENMAAEIYKVSASTIAKGSRERNVGKATVLGAGFGMGADKFVETCVKDGINVSSVEGEAAIKGYRTKYFEVPQMWKAVEKAAIKAVTKPGRRFEANKVVYCMEGATLYCELPSGRRIYYPDAQLRPTKDRWGGVHQKLTYMGKHPVSGKWTRIDTWGGKLVENFVQGAAMDVMAHGIMNAEAAGYPTLFSVHDESVSMVKEDFGSYKEYEALLADAPEWSEGCPIVAEGFESPIYMELAA